MGKSSINRKKQSVRWTLSSFLGHAINAEPRRVSLTAPFYMIWDFMIFCIIVFQFFTFPFRVSFIWNRPIDDFGWVLKFFCPEYLMDIILLIDLYFRKTLFGMYINGLEVIDPVVCHKMYHRKEIWLDSFASIPFDIINFLYLGASYKKR